MTGCLGNLPVERGRGLGFSEINTTTWAYGVIVAEAYKNRGIALEEFLDRFLPSWMIYQNWFLEQSVASLYGIDTNVRLSNVPAWAHVMPWGERSPGEMMRWLPPRIRRNRRANGHEITRWKTYKRIMVEDALTSGRSHGRQFFNLCASINAHGLWEKCNSDDPYKVWLLRDGSDWCWMAYSGNHRTGAVAALGLSEVHVELKGVVSKSDIRRWPNVANGWFAPEEAEMVFDGLFNGRITTASRDLLGRLGRDNHGLAKSS